MVREQNKCMEIYIYMYIEVCLYIYICKHAYVFARGQPLIVRKKSPRRPQRSSLVFVLGAQGTSSAQSGPDCAKKGIGMFIKIREN